MTSTKSGAADSRVTIEKAAYGGWPNCWRIANGEIELVVTGDVGPRVIRAGFVGGQNFFKNFPEQMGGSGEPDWMIRGGARIWVAPEDREASYALDNSAVRVEQSGGVLTATAPADARVPLEKQIEIRMAPAGAPVQVIHRIRNVGALPTELSAWALSVMAPGGVGITGFPPRGTHPECLEPSNPLVMWPFSDLSDKRWIFLKKYLALRQDPAANAPQKLGHFNPRTWGAYWLNGDLFLKRYEAPADLTYSDFGCSFEIFTNADMLELETLGPLVKVAPGESVEHVEAWSLHRDVRIAEWTDEALDEALLPLL
jgi:hypothetical protein